MLSLYGHTSFERSFRISIESSSLIRLSTVTHSVNGDQRHVELDFIQAAGEPEHLLVTAPLGPALAPPGYYMLFAVSTDGVPSVAKMVRLNVALAPIPTLSDWGVVVTAFFIAALGAVLIRRRRPLTHRPG